MRFVKKNSIYENVRAKKSLGQHFLKNDTLAHAIVQALPIDKTTSVLEIGPGTGVLTKYLLVNPNVNLKAIEIDRDSVAYLKKHYPAMKHKIIEGDFLQFNLKELFSDNFSVIGNFPYNISSQIFFKILEMRNQVIHIVCMLQKEVAERIASKHGNKTYGILSVLLQSFYHVEFLFEVPPSSFIPPPNVMSGVIRLTRNTRETLGCNEELFIRVVKSGFNQRRKTLRNALKNLSLSKYLLSLPIMDKRAEQLRVEEFIQLTQQIEDDRSGKYSI